MVEETEKTLKQRSDGKELVSNAESASDIQNKPVVVPLSSSTPRLAGIKPQYQSKGN